MLFPPNESVLHQILKFYATHVMSFVGGIFGAHMYYNTAKALISHTLDISEDRYRHRHSFKGKSKHKKRGWSFKKSPDRKIGTAELAMTKTSK
jgi:hypothetical protein